jgi:hypothetical protein
MDGICQGGKGTLCGEGASATMCEENAITGVLSMRKRCWAKYRGIDWPLQSHSAGRATDSENSRIIHLALESGLQ